MNGNPLADIDWNWLNPFVARDSSLRPIPDMDVADVVIDKTADTVRKVGNAVTQPFTFPLLLLGGLALVALFIIPQVTKGK